MKKTYKSQSLLCELKYNLGDCLRKNKLKLLIICLICLACLVTGIIIAIRHYNAASIHLSQYGLVDFSGGVFGASFFSRFFSMLLIMLLLLACSFTPFTMPIAVLILAYRTYLLGLNLTLMFILYGIPGMIVSAIIALPLQLAIIFVLLMYYLLLHCNSCTCRKYGGGVLNKSKLKTFLIVMVLLFVINLLESLLLAIFSAKVILVL